MFSHQAAFVGQLFLAPAGMSKVNHPLVCCESQCQNTSRPGGSIDGQFNIGIQHASGHRAELEL